MLELCPDTLPFPSTQKCLPAPLSCLPEGHNTPQSLSELLCVQKGPKTKPGLIRGAQEGCRLLCLTAELICAGSGQALL